MRVRMIAAITACFVPSLAAADMIVKPSPYPVAKTLDRLETAVANAGAVVFARVDHAGGAAKIGSELAPMQMLMFGNPKLGTPALQAGPTAGLDLPLRVLAYQDKSGQTQLVYHDPADLADTHGIAPDADVIAKMTGALGKLTDAAIQQ